MKVSLNLMQGYSNVDLKSHSTEKLVKLTTERLGGIEGVTDLSKQYEGLVVAKVVNCIKHPNADKLSLCKIDDGGVVKDVARDEDGLVQVVCGAHNVREGILVAWIPPAAIVPASYGEKELFVLEARDLRGQLSNGMLASQRELGISDDHEGILEIDPDERITSMRHPEPVEGSSQISPQGRDDKTLVMPGTAFKKLYGLDDVILEIENKMFTHRPDGFGHLGVAREIAGIQHKAFKSPEWYLNSVISTEVEKSDQISRQARDDELLSVSIEDDELCPRYMAVVLENVEIKPSPIWLQSYLKRVGVRPINNVVDITNYMMLLTAQPLHAFDFDKVASKASHPELDSGSNNVLDSRLRGNDEESTRDDKTVEIIVRRPKDGEKMTLLDGKEIEPHKDAVLICNPAGPIALGGVMGGGNSEVDENTKRVVLECATFDMYNIRKTSMTHGIFTDAVTRFNKGQPEAQLPAVIRKTINMFEEIVRAKQSSPVVDSQHDQAEARENKSDFIEISCTFINERLGSKLKVDEIISLLKNVEFEAHDASGFIEVRAPFWRTDIEIPEDIVEEIGRLYGFNQLPVELPKRSIAPVKSEDRRAMKTKIRHLLSRAGGNEVLNYSFVHGNLLTKVGQKSEDSYALRNALSPDLQFYRQTLTPSLLSLVHSNIKAGFNEFALFELGKSHNKIHGSGEDNLPGELNMVALTFASKNQSNPGYYSAKRYLDFLATSLGMTLRYDVVESEPGFPVTAPFEYSRSALVTINETDTFIGIIGEYKPAVSKNLKLPEVCAGFEIGLDAVIKVASKISEVNYRQLSKYPSTDKDITLKVDAAINFKTVESHIEKKLRSTDYMWSLSPVSIFQKDGESTKNFSFRINLSHQERTLPTSEANKIIEDLAWSANQEIGAEIV